MGEEPTTSTEHRVRIIHPVMLAQPVWTGVYFGLGFMIAASVVGAAAFLIFGMLGLALTT